MIKVNKYQTPLTKELQDSLPRQIWSQLVDYIESVDFIRYLISTEEVRGFAKDKPKDGNGKIIVDITKPHILEDLDFFRERAIFFEKNGRYTNIPKNPNPKSEYAEFWKEELRRWKYGLHRKSDGEWIPGELYFYWNYCQIWIAKEEIDEYGKVQQKKGNRKKGFPKPYLGDYLFFHYLHQARANGMHAKLLKCRGIGASFKFASMSPRNMYVEPGAGNPNFHLASENSFLKGDKGIWGKVLENLDWIATHTPLPKMRLIDRKGDMEIQLGVEDEYGSRKGLLSSVYGISLKDNPDKARGVRGPLIHYEEDGLFPNLEKAWNVNREATEEDGITFGLMAAAGTGGVSGSSFEGSEKLFYSPNAYNIYGIPNVFDKNTNGQSLCGFFWGGYLNKGSNKTFENGEYDYIASIINILIERKRIADSSNDPAALTQKKAEVPIVPQEAIMRVDGTLFPVSDLKDYLANILPHLHDFVAEHYIGDLGINEFGNIEYKPNVDVHVIREYPASDSFSKLGAIEIFEKPKLGSSGEVPKFRYILGADPIDDDHSTTNSLASVIVFDLLTDRIVAEYTGRPTLANDFYEKCYRLVKYYNGSLMYENDKKGLFTYFSNRNLLHYLADFPQILKDMDVATSSNRYGNKSKGFNSGKLVNAYGRRLQRDWMLSPAYNEEESGLLNLHKIRSIGYLREAISWNMDGNFDRVSAMNAVMILREEYYKYTLQMKEQGIDEFSKLPSEDPFFNVNYDAAQGELTEMQIDIAKEMNLKNGINLYEI